MFLWEKICLQLIKMIFPMVEDMCTLCSIIWSGVQSTEKKVLKDGIDVECKEMLESLAQEYKFQILAMEVMPDHIHLLVDCRPQFYISDMIKIMKGNLAHQMFLLHPELKKELWGGHLWNPSYCVVTVSDRSREQVLAYIEGQKEKSR